MQAKSSLYPTRVRIGDAEVQGWRGLAALAPESRYWTGASGATWGR